MFSCRQAKCLDDIPTIGDSIFLNSFIVWSLIVIVHNQFLQFMVIVDAVDYDLRKSEWYYDL